MGQPSGKPGNTSKLLLHEEPLQVLPALAVALGLNEAIVLQQLHYWLRRKAHHRDGRDWHYNRYIDWQKQFPFWSVSTIKRTMVSLEKSGVIITANYNNSPIDKTKWYAINYDKLNELCESTTAQNEPSRDQDEPSTAQNEPSRDQDEPSTDQIDTLHGSSWSHQYPETNTETTDREKTLGESTHARRDTHDLENFESRFSAPPSRICPPGFVPDPSIRQWAQEQYPDVNYDEAFAAMCDYEFDKPKSDWNAALRTWIRRQATDFNRRPLPRQRRAVSDNPHGLTDKEARTMRNLAAMMHDTEEDDDARRRKAPLLEGPR